jgi:hypothetical protein
VSGFEPLTCRLQEVRPRAPSALAARMARVIALMTPAALGLSDATFHEPFHAFGGNWPMAVTERSDRKPPQRRRIGHCIAESSLSSDQAAPLRVAGSGAPRAVPNHGGQLIRTACMARKLGAAAGLLRRIRCARRALASSPLFALSVDDRHSPTLGPGQRLDR